MEVYNRQVQIWILKLNSSKTTNIYTMGLCVLYYVEYSLYNVKEVGYFLSGLEFHFQIQSICRREMLPNIENSFRKCRKHCGKRGK